MSSAKTPPVEPRYRIFLPFDQPGPDHRFSADMAYAGPISTTYTTSWFSADPATVPLPDYI